jgi:hypothetical protein
MLQAYMCNAAIPPTFIAMPIPAEKNLNRGTKTLGRMELGLPPTCTKPA